METKDFDRVDLHAEPEGQGRFTALICTFDKPDKHGDIIRRGAFADTLAQWKTSGARVPVIFSHLHRDPQAFIGEVDPQECQETATGFEVSGALYVNEPNGKKVWQQLSRRTLKEWSFGYIVTKAKSLAKGAREILGLDLLEIGPTLVGVGDTATLNVKAADLVKVAKDRFDARRKAARLEQFKMLEADLVAARQQFQLTRAEQQLAALWMHR